MTDPATPSAEDVAREIARRTRAEENLRRHRIEQQVLLDMIPAMVWVKDPENRIIRANRHAAEMIGRRVDELENASTYDLYPNEAAKYHKDDIEVIRSGMPKLGIVEEFTAAGGDKRWVQTDKVPYFADDGTPIGVVVFAQDVTDRKREESRLQTMATGLRAVIEMADELIMCPDTDTFYRRAVELARERLHVERCAIFKFDKRVAWGMFGTDLEGRTTDERANSFEIVEEWEEHFATIRPEKSRWVLKRDADRWNWDGTQSRVIGRGWVSYTAIARPGRRATALFIHDAAITSEPFDTMRQELVAVYCSLLAEIIEQKKSADVVRESEKKFRSLAETVDASIFLFQGQALTYVNPAASRMSGYSQAELVTMNFWDLIHPDFKDLVRERGLARQRGEKIPPRYELKIRTKLGVDRWIDYSSSLVDFDGKPAVLGVAIDISERKRAEEQLFQRVESERTVMRVATDLGSVTAGTAEKRVRGALAEVAGFLGAQTASMILFSDDSASVSEVHEWRARGVPSVKDQLAAVPIQRVKYAVPRVLSGQPVRVERVEDLPALAVFERGLCESAGILSFVLVPVVSRGHVTGSLAVGCTKDHRAWTDEHVSFLTLAAEILSNALHRERLEEEHMRLAKKVLELQEEERKKLSDVLHDDVGQLLTLASMELGAVKTADRKSAAIVRSAAKRAQAALKAVRSLAGSLRPPTLDEFGIAAGLKTLCREYNRPPGLKVECSTRVAGVTLGDAQRTCLYRVLQEALTNAVRHSHATRVKVTFTRMKGAAVLEIHDNGRGFNVGALTLRRGIGLIGMKERLTACGGGLVIKSLPGEGTMIRATVPRPRAARA